MRYASAPIELNSIAFIFVAFPSLSAISFASKCISSLPSNFPHVYRMIQIDSCQTPCFTRQGHILTETVQPSMYDTTGISLSSSPLSCSTYESADAQGFYQILSRTTCVHINWHVIKLTTSSMQITTIHQSNLAIIYHIRTYTNHSIPIPFFKSKIFNII